MYDATMIPRVWVYKVMQDFYHQQRDWQRTAQQTLPPDREDSIAQELLTALAETPFFAGPGHL